MARQDKDTRPAPDVDEEVDAGALQGPVRRPAHRHASAAQDRLDEPGTLPIRSAREEAGRVERPRRGERAVRFEGETDLLPGPSPEVDQPCGGNAQRTPECPA